MEKYIEGNKAAWEEAFENRAPSWGIDIADRIEKEEYPFFNEETKNVLKALDLEGTVIGQFCCNNGRELLSLVKNGRAKKGIGFDIAVDSLLSTLGGQTGLTLSMQLAKEGFLE